MERGKPSLCFPCGLLLVMGKSRAPDVVSAMIDPRMTVLIARQPLFGAAQHPRHQIFSSRERREHITFCSAAQSIDSDVGWHQWTSCDEMVAPERRSHQHHPGAEHRRRQEGETNLKVLSSLSMCTKP